MHTPALPRRRSYRDPPPTPAHAGAGSSWRALVPTAVVLCWLVLLTPAARGPERAATVVSLVAAAAAVGCWLRVWLLGQERLVWSLFALGSSCYAFGWFVVLHVSAGEAGGPGGLNYSDCVSLLIYPLWHTAFVLRSRTGQRGWSRRALLDGAVVALAVAAAAVGLTAELAPATFAGSWVQAVYAAAYPIGSAVLVGTALLLVVALRFHVERRWCVLAGAFVVMFTGQALFAQRAGAFGTWIDAVYLAGPVGVAVAAWVRPPARPVERSRVGTPMTVTALSTLLALVVLVARQPDTPVLAVGLAAGAVVAAVLRTTLFIGQDQLLAIRTEQALTDGLTGLANRRSLIAALETSDPVGSRTLVLLDLDRFKRVNDSLGHGAGDELLREVAVRLRRLTPAGGTAARLGGDEFALLLPLPLAEAVVRAREVRSCLERPFVVQRHQVGVGASLGLTEVGIDHVDDCTELLRRADVALYKAKQAASAVEVWTAELDESAQDLVTLVAELRTALRRDDQVSVHLQPQCDPHSGRVVALEALVRWVHPRRGLLEPLRFLAAAEAAGLLPQLTQRVLHRALADAVVLRAAGYALPVAVNLGVADLLDPRFAARVAQLLDAHGLPASALRLEVTETVVMRDPARIVRTLRLLSGIGIGLSLDDYGTGLASLGYLRELPIDELKIDRSFVTPYLSDTTSRVITDSTVDLAHKLGLTVVAEGIEDDATAAALAAAGCDRLQGWACGRPVPLEQLLVRLERDAAAAVPTLRGGPPPPPVQASLSVAAP